MDILIIKHYGTATITGKTIVGQRWIRVHMTEESPVRIDAEFVNEWIKDMEKDGLTVEER